MAAERLQKIIARAGITSRRKAEGLITAGRVAVNGEIVRELGSTADPRRDLITLDGKHLFEETKRYLLINKPKRMLCALRDRFDRPLITDLLGDEVRERVFPAGRLDYDSEGLVLLTNDGDLMEAITRPGHGVAKVYEVTVAGDPSEDDLRKLAGGVFLEAQPEWRPVGWEDEREGGERNVETEGKHRGETEGTNRGAMDDRRPQSKTEAGLGEVEEEREGQVTLPCTIERLASAGAAEGSSTSRFRVTLHEGKKNQIRRMFAIIDAPVQRLVRVGIGALTLDDLPDGGYRDLSAAEVEALRREVRAQKAGGTKS